MTPALRLSVGTRSVLYGAHCFFLHPWFVAWAWWKLYGFPWDPRLWVAFFVHDLGYIGKPNMDGAEGERHPVFGADVMSLFDGTLGRHDALEGRAIHLDWRQHYYERFYGRWAQLSLLHSRYYAKKLGLPFSRLCVADKLAIALTPWWLYLPMVNATGEIHEYLKNAQRSESEHWRPTGFDQRRWYTQLQAYMRKWVDEHKDGRQDTWTSTDRHTRTESGVWQ